MNSDHKRWIAAGCMFLAMHIGIGGWFIITRTPHLSLEWLLALAAVVVAILVIGQHFHQSAELDDLVNEYAR